MVEARTFLARLFQRVLLSDLQAHQIQVISQRLVEEVGIHHLAGEVDQVEVMFRVAVRATRDTADMTVMEVIQVLAPAMATAISRTPVMGEETLTVQDPEPETTARTTDMLETIDDLAQDGLRGHEPVTWPFR